jgi:hypothetical protein
VLGLDCVGFSQGGATALGGYCDWGEAGQDVGADVMTGSLDCRAVHDCVRHEVHCSRGEGARLDCSRGAMQVDCLLGRVGEADPGVAVCEEGLWVGVVGAAEGLAALVIGVPCCVPWMSGCQWVEVEVAVGAKHLSAYLAESWGKCMGLTVGRV